MGKLIAVVVAMVAVLSFAGQAGAEFAASPAWLFRLAVLGCLALAVILGVLLYHRRKSHELIVARYHLKGDGFNWPKHRTEMGQVLRSCPDCGMLSPSYKSQEIHIYHHQDLDTLADRVAELEGAVAALGGGVVREPDPKPVPWTAVVEDSTGGEVDTGPDQLDEMETRGRRFRGLMERISSGAAHD